MTPINVFGSFTPTQWWLLGAMMIWSLIWKGLALWKAARLAQKPWFIIMLIVNTVGILEIIYLFFVARHYERRSEV